MLGLGYLQHVNMALVNNKKMHFMLDGAKLIGAGCEGEFGVYLVSNGTIRPSGGMLTSFQHEVLMSACNGNPVPKGPVAALSDFVMWFGACSVNGAPLPEGVAIQAAGTCPQIPPL